MGRPVYPHELSDADFSWLINSYKENNPSTAVVETSCLPIVLITDCIAQPKETLPPPPVDLNESEVGDLKEGD